MEVTSFFSRFKTTLKAIYQGPWYKKIGVWTLTAILTIILTLIAIDINLLWLFGKSPGFADIKNPTVSEASEIYSADGKLLGRYFNENRTPVQYEEISPILIRTLIDTEDERFYLHHGIDVVGLMAAVKDMAGGRARGASTITQQLAKNMFRVRTKYSSGLLGNIPGVKILVMKAKEWIVATKLEYIFSKEEILTMYFNTVDFGSNSFGIKTAARTYFGTTPDLLSYEQSAVLVGLLKATSSYNPRLNPKNSLERRNTVLELVYEHGHIFVNGEPATIAQLDSIKSLPTILANRELESSYDGEAPYFREALKEYINMLCENNLIPGYDAINKLDLFADGLKIYTTLDSRMQKYAENVVNEQMQEIQQRFDSHWGSTPPWQDGKHKEIPNFIEDIAKKTTAYKYLSNKFSNNSDSINYYLNQPHPVKVFSYGGTITKEMSTLDSIRYMVKFMHTGLYAIEPDTREVKAWVGDINFDSWKFDKVTATRQPGSTFKLFVYTEAMNQGLSPCDRRLDTYASYPNKSDENSPAWTPHNADGVFSGANMSLKKAFASSVNSIAVKVGLEVGVNKIAETAYRMGIKTKLDVQPSLTLGSSDVCLEELVNSYCTVVNDGKYNMPIMVTRIEDRDGNLIYLAKKDEKQAIPYRSAYLMQTMLQGGLSGTSYILRNYVGRFSDTDFGGKTGTSNNHSDAWFVGVSPKLVVGSWVGGEYRCIHFRTGMLGQGNKTALPICGAFLKKVFEDNNFKKYHTKFNPPKNLDPSLWTCAGYIATENDSIEDDYSDTYAPNADSDEGTDISSSENTTTEATDLEY